MTLTQTRRRRSGSLDLFRLRAGLDRMKNKTKKKEEQSTRAAHARTWGPLLPGENGPGRAGPGPSPPAHTGVINVKSVHFHGRFPVLTTLISSRVDPLHTRHKHELVRNHLDQESTWSPSRTLENGSPNPSRGSLFQPTCRRHGNALRSGSGGTRTRTCCYNITGSVKFSHV